MEPIDLFNLSQTFNLKKKSIVSAQGNKAKCNKIRSVCNEVYFRSNSLLDLKETKRRARCLSYPECLCGAERKNSGKNCKRPGARL